MPFRRAALVFGVMLGAMAGPVAGQAPAANRLMPNLVDNIERPLRYRPDGADFVIENGAERFNRPLYGGNTAFRVDGGDKPEFVLYLPGRGGNLRLAVCQVERADPGAFSGKWLHEAAQITTRYRPGQLLYEIRDPLLGAKGVLRLAVVAWHQAEGLGLRVEAEALAPGLELVWAYGGVNGQRGTRDGDIGTERVPISEWFQLQPEFCRNNVIELTGEGFTLRAPLPRDQAATIAGVAPAGAKLAVADASSWNDLPALLAYVGPSLADRPKDSRQPSPALPVLVGRVGLQNATPLYLSVQRPAVPAAATDLDTYKEVGAPQVERADSGALGSEKRAGVSAFHPADLPAAFAATEAHFAALREQVLVVTPDPFLNAAAGALSVAADAVWDEPQGAVMHGAIAWRTRLLGWRGPYAMDALGWHERARRHLAYWATRQNTGPIPGQLPPPEPETNLARSRRALHSNGDMAASHYDMNLVYIDALFRHLLWTGDLKFAREVWPVIERHLAWERRLFRREFEVNGEKLPLYEAYAAIWASDDLQYHGGGTTHASAYNYWHNRMAAKIAESLGLDPEPFQHEAELIHRGVQALLWTGTHYAEFKDLLGRQLVHPSAGLWTFYHAMDAGWIRFGETSDHVLRHQPRLPIRGPGVPTDRDYGMFASTDWLPYTWSINNVVMGENIHTALGFWQDRRPEAAFTLLKSSLLASMFMGICPGNVGSMNYLDVYRRESQRDFADGNGVTSRALVEGLFGIRPDALAGEIEIMPGFPENWDHAQLAHPSVRLSFLRRGAIDTYEFAADAGKFTRFMLRVRARGAACRVTRETPGLEPLRMTATDMSTVMGFGGEIRSSAKVTIEWVGEFVPEPSPAPSVPLSVAAIPQSSAVSASFAPIDLAGLFNDRVTEIFKPGKYVSPRSPFVSLALPAQGIGAWAGHVNATAEIDDAGLRSTAARNDGRITVPNGVSFVTPGPGEAKNVLFTSQWDNYPREATVPASGRARRLHLLMAGSTNAMQSRLDNGEVIVSYTDGTTSRLALRNPETWWPIDQDYFIDDYQFRVDGPLPTRVNLKTGEVRVLDAKTFKGQGRVVPGGAATVLALDLDPAKELKSLTVRALANEVVIGLMAATLER